MWMYLNNSMVSIVETPKHDDVQYDPEDLKYLSVRARSEDDLLRWLGHVDYDPAQIIVTPNRDYACRTFLPRKVVAERIAEIVTDISYFNFKDSIPPDDVPRYNAYLDTWQVARNWQTEQGDDDPEEW